MSQRRIEESRRLTHQSLLQREMDQQIKHPQIDSGGIRNQVVRSTQTRKLPPPPQQLLQKMNPHPFLKVVLVHLLKLIQRYNCNFSIDFD